MSVRPTLTIRCDHVDAAGYQCMHEFSGVLGDPVRAGAGLAGWSATETRDYCPEHAGDAEEVTEPA